MHVLTDKELYEAIEYARNIDETNGRKVMESFQVEQPALSQTLFNIFPSLIAQQNQDMANVFMELTFDAICVYQYTFGKVPIQTEEWLERQVALLDAELQSLNPNKHMDTKIRGKLTDRFSDRAIDDITQVKLIEVMNESIDDYAAESTDRIPYIKFTQTMMFAVIRLLSKLYNQQDKQR